MLRGDFEKKNVRARGIGIGRRPASMLERSRDAENLSVDCQLGQGSDAENAPAHQRMHGLKRQGGHGHSRGGTRSDG